MVVHPVAFGAAARADGAAALDQGPDLAAHGRIQWMGPKTRLQLAVYHENGSNPLQLVVNLYRRNPKSI